MECQRKCTSLNLPYLQCNIRRNTIKQGSVLHWIFHVFNATFMSFYSEREAIKSLLVELGEKVAYFIIYRL